MNYDAIYECLPEAGKAYFLLFCEALRKGKPVGNRLAIKVDKAAYQGALPKPWAKLIADEYGDQYIAVAAIDGKHLVPLKAKTKAQKALSDLRQSIKQSADKRLVENYTRGLQKAARSNKKHELAAKLVEFLQQAHDVLDLPLYDLSFTSDRGLVRNRKAAYAALAKAIHANLHQLPRFLTAILWCLKEENWLIMQEQDRKLGKFHIGLLANEVFLRKVEDRKQ